MELSNKEQEFIEKLRSSNKAETYIPRAKEEDTYYSLTADGENSDPGFGLLPMKAPRKHSRNPNQSNYRGWFFKNERDCLSAISAVNVIVFLQGCGYRTNEKAEKQWYLTAEGVESRYDGRGLLSPPFDTEEAAKTALVEVTPTAWVNAVNLFSGVCPLEKYNKSYEEDL